MWTVWIIDNNWYTLPIHKPRKFRTIRPFVTDHRQGSIEGSLQHRSPRQHLSIVHHHQWLVVEPTPLKNMRTSVGKDDYSHIYIWNGKIKIHGSKPPTSHDEGCLTPHVLVVTLLNYCLEQKCFHEFHSPIAPVVSMQPAMFDDVWWLIPSGKHTKNYGKPPFLMDKSVNLH